MKKLNYKAINVNKLDWSKMRANFSNRHVVFSVDVAKSTFVGLLITEDREAIQLIKWNHPQDS